MKRKLWGGIALLALAAIWVGPAQAQAQEKPRMYSYVGFWDIPRAQWADMAKSDAGDKAVLDKAMASGAIVGYGTDMNLVHSVEGPTHDQWWSSMSMAGLLSVLNQFYTNGSATSPVLGSAIKHWDAIYVSRYYNWHSGSWTGVYGTGGSFKLKQDAPDDALDLLAKGVLVPLFEKMLADGSIHEYEIDTEAIHSEAPGTFWIAYIAANADSLDKINQSVRDAMKASPLSSYAISSMVDWSKHRDFLDMSTATYK